MCLRCLVKYKNVIKNELTFDIHDYLHPHRVLLWDMYGLTDDCKIMAVEQEDFIIVY